MAKNPYKDSPYDAAGMPLDTTYVDYDKKEDVAAKTVHDKYVEPMSLFSDTDAFEEAEIKRTKYNPVLNNTAIQAPGYEAYVTEEPKEDNDLLKLLKDSDNDGK